QRKAKDVIVDTTNLEAVVSFSFSAPDERLAAALQEELEGYFETLPGKALVPPWLPQDSRSAQEKAQQQLARHTYLHLQKRQDENYENAEIVSLEKKMEAAQRQHDRTLVIDLNRQVQQLRHKLGLQNLQRVASGAKGPIDTNLAELFISLRSDESETNSPNTRLIEEIAQRMGQLPLVNDEPASDADRFSAQRATVVRNKLRLDLM